MIDRKPPEITRTDEIAMMYPAPHSRAVVTALVPPNDLPTNVMNPPVEGWARENCDSVLPSSAIAITAATMVSGAAIPAVATIRPKPNMKLYAGPMFAIVEAAISTRPRAPRCSRSGASGAFVYENGTDMAPPRLRRRARRHSCIVGRGTAHGKSRDKPVIH